MPGTSTASNPQGWTISFDEASHSYTTLVKGDKTDATRIYTSGTQFVHRFFPRFDADGAIAERKARERGTTPEQIRFEWKQNAAAACAMGTRVHETCEDILNNSVDLVGNYIFRNKPADDKERKLFSAGFTAATKVKETMNVVGVEKIVFDFDSAIAGTIDLLTQDSAGTVWILDWKTNRKIDMRNTFHKDSHAFHPIEHLENCNYIQYSLQLNLYQYLLVKAGYYPRNTSFRRGIFHLTEEGPKFIEMPELQTEIRDMLIAFHETPPF